MRERQSGGDGINVWWYRSKKSGDEMSKGEPDLGRERTGTRQGRL